MILQLVTYATGKHQLHRDRCIVYSRQGTRSIGQIVESLALIYEVYSPEDIKGRVEFL